MFSPKDGAFDELIAMLKIAIAEVHDDEGRLLYAIH